MLLPAKLAIFAASIVVALGFAIGFVSWDANPYGCFNGRGFYGEWVTLYQVGKLQLRIRAWGCTASQRYDPKHWQSLYGPDTSPGR